MNAAPRPFVSAQRRRSRRPGANSRIRETRLKASTRVTSISSTVGQKVTRLNPSRQTAPMWLQVLLFLQRGSDIIAFLLVGSTLTIYSWTVYNQQQWAKEYRKLETLQRNERELTKTNEVMKNQLAQQAESPATGLINPTQANTIILPPAPERQPNRASTEENMAPEPMGRTPLGY
ncbi:MAG: hypothetical protein F6K47_19665 [Symploca sp. SIO2E6]|nr:hypothetical protein [Symploca sp. SIO2E6]